MSCKACQHPRRDEIDQQLISGVPLRSIVASTGLSLGGLVRHKQHLKETLGLALKERLPAERTEHGSELLNRVEKLISEAESILVCSKASQDWKGATAAIGACTRLLELLGRVNGELMPQHAPGLHVSLVSNRTTNINAQGSDEELAELVSEATEGFNPRVIERLRALATGQPITEPICIDHAPR